MHKIKALYDESGGFKKRENGGRKKSVLIEDHLAQIKAEDMKELTKQHSTSTRSISIGIKELRGKFLAISK